MCENKKGRMTIRPFFYVVYIIYILLLRFFFDYTESVLKNFIFLQAYYRMDNSFMFNIN